MFLFCFDTELNKKHQLATIAKTYHNTTHKTYMLSSIMKGKSFTIAIVAYSVAYIIVNWIHQMTFFNRKNLVKCTTGMETYCSRGILWYFCHYGTQTFRMLVWKYLPYLVGKTELHFIAVFFSLYRPKDRRTFR